MNYKEQTKQQLLLKIKEKYKTAYDNTVYEKMVSLSLNPITEYMVEI